MEMSEKNPLRRRWIRRYGENAEDVGVKKAVQDRFVRDPRTRTGYREMVGGRGHKCLSKMACKEKDMHTISSKTRLINISARTSSIFVLVQMNILNTDQI